MEEKKLFDKLERTLDSNADSLQIWKNILTDSLKEEDGEFTSSCTEQMQQVAGRMEQIVAELRGLWKEVTVIGAENSKRKEASK